MTEDNTVFGGGTTEPESQVNIIRSATNLRHHTINQGHPQEITSPPWADGVGYFAMKKPNKFADGYIDFNFKDCTDGSTNWKFKWLVNNQSEFDSTRVTYDKEKPVEFGRQEWSMKDGNKGGSDHGANSLKLFNNRNAAKGVRAVSRTSCNLNRKYWWGHTDHLSFGKKTWTTYNHSVGAKANYIRAKGITFRYKVYQEETNQTGEALDDRENHGFTPIVQALMFFVGKENDYVYCAELIAASKQWTTHGNAAGGQMESKGSLADRDRARHETGKVLAKTDWSFKYYSGDTTKPSVGGGPWDEHGWRAQYERWPFGYKASGWQKNVSGTAVMSLSQKACDIIWDNDMVCVGWAVCSATTNRDKGTVASDMGFTFWDYKLLEQEYKGDNQIPGGDILGDSQYKAFTTLTKSPMTVKEATTYYNKLRTKKERVDVTFQMQQ